MEHEFIIGICFVHMYACTADTYCHSCCWVIVFWVDSETGCQKVEYGIVGVGHESPHRFLSVAVCCTN